MSTRLRHDNRTGYRGVDAPASGRGRFRAQIEIRPLPKVRRNIFLGLHDTPEEAARAYDRAALEHFGERAILNFPDEVA